MGSHNALWHELNENVMRSHDSNMECENACHALMTGLASSEALSTVQYAELERDDYNHMV